MKNLLSLKLFSVALILSDTSIVASNLSTVDHLIIDRYIQKAKQLTHHDKYAQQTFERTGETSCNLHDLTMKGTLENSVVMITTQFSYNHIDIQCSSEDQSLKNLLIKKIREHQQSKKTSFFSSTPTFDKLSDATKFWENEFSANIRSVGMVGGDICLKTFVPLIVIQEKFNKSENS